MQNIFGSLYTIFNLQCSFIRALVLVVALDMIELFTQITYKLSELFISLSRNLYTLSLHVTFVLDGYILHAHCCGAFLGSQRVESFEKFFQNK